MNQAAILKLARFLLRLAINVTPDLHRDWAAAMAGEFAAADCPEVRLKWAAGCLRASVLIRLASFEGRWEAGCTASLALLTLFDWQRADPTLTVFAIGFAAAALSFLNPERWWHVGLLFGLWLLVAHSAADIFVQLRPHYQHLPLTTEDFLVIGLLLAVTVPSAAIGGHCGQRAKRGRRPIGDSSRAD